MSIPNNPFITLHQCKKRVEQIQSKLVDSSPYKKAGVLNFDHFHLKHEKKEVERKMTEIRRLTHPDIIA